jgi:hypothetical protein
MSPPINIFSNSLEDENPKSNVPINDDEVN